jgi:hypothetical protein
MRLYAKKEVFGLFIFDKYFFEVLAHEPVKTVKIASGIQ